MIAVLTVVGILAVAWLISRRVGGYTPGRWR